MGLGHAGHGDDGLGLKLAEDLQAAGFSEVILAGLHPEQWLGQLMQERYDHLVFLDAVEFGAAPGALVFLDASEMERRFPQVSTHQLSLSTLAALVTAHQQTKVWLLGVQPATLHPGELSLPVRKTLEILPPLLTTLWLDQEQTVGALNA